MTQREALSRPIPPEDISWRPGAAKWDHKPNCPGATCRETKDPDKHMQLAYVDDETVMDRFDEGFGTGHWQLLVEPVPVYEGVVKVKLGVTYDLENWVWYEDFGYANRSDGDVLKEAVTDGIRRLGRFVSPAVRELYRKGAIAQPTTQGRAATPATARPAPSPQPPSSPSVAGGAPEEPEYVREMLQGEQERPVAPSNAAGCPIHHKPWKVNSRGGYCPSKNPDGSWCQEKPRAIA